jgi:hypothetical protein
MAALMRFHIVALAVALLLPISGASLAAQGSRHSSSPHSRSAVVKNHNVITSRADASRIRAFDPRALRAIRGVRDTTFLIPTDHMETPVIGSGCGTQQDLWHALYCRGAFVLATY